MSIPQLCVAALTALAATAATAQSAANYPNKPVRVIVPYAAGGSTSTATQILSDRLAKEMGQSLVFDNRPGGNTIIGVMAVVKSPADGYTLLGISNTLAINEWTQPNLPYATLKDLVGVSTLVSDRDAMAVHASLPVNNLKEFIAYAKANPGKVVARIQAGTITHVSVILFMEATGTKLNMVSYKGSGSAQADMLSGVIHMSLTSPSNVVAHIKSGKLKGLAVAGDKRNAALPDTPTFAEQGLKGLKAGDNWIMLLAPGATPRDIVEKINAFTARAQADKEAQGMLAKVGFDVLPNSVAATNALLRSDIEVFGKVVKEHNIKADDV